MKDKEIIFKIIRLDKSLPLPKYQTSGSAGMDLYASIKEPFILMPMNRKLVNTGIAIQLPKNFEAQVRSRSSLALKHGISLVNGIGTIDSDYTGEIGVILINLSNKPFEINNGDRIAQLIINEITKVNFVEVEILEKTERGAGGFGSTGRNS